MNFKSISLTAAVLAAGLSTLVATPAFAQAKEQFFPLLVYRTGPCLPLAQGVPLGA